MMLNYTRYDTNDVYQKHKFSYSLLYLDYKINLAQKEKQKKKSFPPFFFFDTKQEEEEEEEET